MRVRGSAWRRSRVVPRRPGGARRPSIDRRWCTRRASRAARSGGRALRSRRRSTRESAGTVHRVCGQRGQSVDDPCESVWTALRTRRFCSSRGTRSCHRITAPRHGWVLFPCARRGCNALGRSAPTRGQPCESRHSRPRRPAATGALRVGTGLDGLCDLPILTLGSRCSPWNIAGYRRWNTTREHGRGAVTPVGVGTVLAFRGGQGAENPQEHAFWALLPLFHVEHRHEEELWRTTRTFSRIVSNASLSCFVLLLTTFCHHEDSRSSSRGTYPRRSRSLAVSRKAHDSSTSVRVAGCPD